MPVVRRQNPGVLQSIQLRLKDLEGLQAKAGWFESSKYGDGTPVAYIASIHEFGVHILRYGPNVGTFSIVIPPRPFMRPTSARESANWVTLAMSGAKAVVAGKTTGWNVMESLGLRAASDIARSITMVFSPQLKQSTINARLSRRSDKTTVGLLTKPLEDTGKMYGEVVNSTVNHRVERV